LPLYIFGGGDEVEIDQAPTHIEVTMFKDHTITRAQREADKAFKKVKAKETMTDYAKAQQSLQDNRERLKAERLAREAKVKAGGK
jgi:F0F1-type ATP synthase epsilon subunit